MKKNSLKKLSIALALGSTLTLASCDKISNLFSSSSETTVATASADNKATTDSNKAVAKAYNKTPATDNKATTTPEKTNLDLSTAAIAKSLANAKDLDPKKVLANLDTGYTPFLAQVGGLKLDSQDVKELNTFVENYGKTSNSNNANNSLYSNFASDLGTEAQVFSQDKPGYDYPALPQATGNDTEDEKLYQAYKQELVNNFLKQVDGRLKVYKDPNFQKKFFNAEQKDIPALLTQADQLVANYKSVTKKLTSGSVACDKLSGLNTKAKCFRDYLGLIANYPTTLYALAENDPSAVTPDFLDKTANPIVKFENAYLTSPEVAANEESQINQTVKVAKTAVANLASDIKDKASAAVDSIKETASKVVDAVTNSDAADKTKEVATEAKDKAKEVANKVADTTKESTEKAKEVASDAKDKAKEVADKVVDKTKEVVTETKDKAKEVADKVADKTAQATEKAKEVVTDAKDKVVEVAKNVTDKAKDLVDSSKDKVKDEAEKTTEKATDKAKEVTDKTKDAVDNAKDKAKETANKVADKTKEVVTDTKDQAKDTAKKLATKTEEVTDKVKEAADNAKDKAEDSAKKLVNKTEQATDKTKEAVEDKKEESGSVVDTIKEKTSDVVDAIKEKTSAVVEATKEKASSIASAVKEKVSSVVEATKEKASDLVDKAKSLVSSDKEEVAAASATTAAVASAIHSAYNLPGYTYSLDKAANLLANIDDESDVKAIQTLNDVYPDVISQIAGFEYESPENLVVEQFAKNYKLDEAKNNSLFSLYNNFANDLNDEVADLTSDSSENYPSLPTSADALDAYRDQLVDNFTKAITDRLAVYKTEAYQKRYFEYKDDAELETLLNNADKLVGSFIALVQTATLDTPKACTVGSVETQAKCFRTYVKILAEYPNVLLNGYFAEQQPDNAVASPDFLDNTAKTVVDFVKTYNK